MVSILIPTYQRLEVLKRCLASVLPQADSDVEIVVVDDGSNDGTKEYILQLTKDYNCIKIHINEQNRGVNYTRNRGIELASKKFILFLDSDDELYEGSLAIIKETLIANPTVKHFLFVGSDRIEEFATETASRHISYKDWITTKVYGDFTHVVSTELMKKNLFFEQHRAFEYLNWLRIKKANNPQLLIPIVTTKRDRGREDSLTVAGRFITVDAIRASFEADKFYYSYYHEDLKAHYPKALNTNLLRAILLGVASDQKNDSRQLIRYASRNYIKWLGTLITFFPSSLVKNIVIKYSKSKAL